MKKINKNIVVFIQARMGSSRLPGKVLKKVKGKPILLHMINRVMRAKTINQVVVITSKNTQDNLIEDFCINNNIEVYRGSELDLLDRHYKAALIYKADFVIKIPSDCPLTDPELIDRVANLWIDNHEKYDYVSNYHPPSFPDGLDVEGCTIEALSDAWIHAKKDYEREHTFPYIWDQPDKFKIGNLLNPYGDMFMSYRWTLDYEKDLEFIKKIFDEFKDKEFFSFKDVLNLLNNKPYISEINHELSGINWYRHHEKDLNTVATDLIKRSKDDK